MKPFDLLSQPLHLNVVTTYISKILLSENTFAGHWEDYIENMVKGKHQINLTMELPQNTMNQSEHMALL